MSNDAATLTNSKTVSSCSLGELLRSALDIDVGEPHLAEAHISGICQDSRLARPGCLFVAIAGAKGDGAQFVADAVRRGARAVVADREIEMMPGVPLIVVPSAREAVSKLAAQFHGLSRTQAAGEMSVIGITGTNGKSTTAYMIRAILQSASKPTALFGTIEYDLVSRVVTSTLTTPDPIELVKHLVEAHEAGARHAVMEVSSHSLDQRREAGIRFSTGVFTNLTQDHLDYHGTMEAYGFAKRRMFDRLDENGTAIVNIDDPAAEIMLAACKSRVIRYGIEGEADLRADHVELTRTGCTFNMAFEGRKAQGSIQLAGLHNVYNALGAVGAALSMGMSLEEAAQGLAQLKRVPGRLQRIETEPFEFDIYVDYAHTDDALRNVLTALRPITEGRLVCVFGCGGDRDRTKRPRMARAVTDCADAFIITSDNPRTEDPLAIIAEIESGLTPDGRIRGVTEPDRAEAINLAIDRLRPTDTLLIAGKGHEDYQIIGTEKIHFDDAEVAAEAVKRRLAAR